MNGQSNGRDARARRAFRDYLAIGVALAAAIFTAWQAVEAQRTRLDAERAAQTARADSERALSEQLRQATAAVAQAERAASAAERTADIQNRILMTQHRGYVGTAYPVDSERHHGQCGPGFPEDVAQFQPQFPDDAAWRRYLAACWWPDAYSLLPDAHLPV